MTSSNSSCKNNSLQFLRFGLDANVKHTFPGGNATGASCGENLVAGQTIRRQWGRHDHRHENPSDVDETGILPADRTLVDLVRVLTSLLKKSNEDGFANYYDWQMPTLKDLRTLYEPHKTNSQQVGREMQIHIDPIFAKEGFGGLVGPGSQRTFQCLRY